MIKTDYGEESFVVLKALKSKTRGLKKMISYKRD